MFKYKKLLVVAYDQEKTQSALAHVSQILSENNISFVTYTPKTDLPSTDYTESGEFLLFFVLRETPIKLISTGCIEVMIQRVQ